MSEEFEGLSLVDLLDLLEPVPEPEPISMFPQTIGWVWLGLFLSALAIWLGSRFILYRKANAYRRTALTELQRVGEDPVEIAAVLRRAAMVAYPRDKVASLSGPEWLAFLDNSFSGSGFHNGPGAVLSAAPYTEAHDPSPGLNALACNWVRKHTPESRT